MVAWSRKCHNTCTGTYMLHQTSSSFVRWELVKKSPTSPETKTKKPQKAQQEQEKDILGSILWTCKKEQMRKLNPNPERYIDQKLKWGQDRAVCQSRTSVCTHRQDGSCVSGQSCHLLFIYSQKTTALDNTIFSILPGWENLFARNYKWGRIHHHGPARLALQEENKAA